MMRASFAGQTTRPVEVRDGTHVVPVDVNLRRARFKSELRLAPPRAGRRVLIDRARSLGKFWIRVSTRIRGGECPARVRNRVADPEPGSHTHTPPERIVGRHAARCRPATDHPRAARAN